MSGWFELNKNSNSSSQYHFVLKAGNGEVILSSESYQSEASAKNGISSVQVNSPLDDRYEKRTSQKEQPYGVLKAANNQIIGMSQMYSSTAARDVGIASVKANGSTATIKVNT
mgnify:CR=1 FL=1